MSLYYDNLKYMCNIQKKNYFYSTYLMKCKNEFFYGVTILKNI